jgi:hypothetical protein
MSKHITKYSIVYWEKLGFTEEESLEKVLIYKQLKRKNKKICIEYWLQRGFSNEEAVSKISEIQSENSKKVKNRFNPRKLQSWINKGFSNEEAEKNVKLTQKKSSRLNIIFWTNKGFSNEEAVAKISEIQSENSKKVKNHTNDVNIEYYLNKGFSKEEAILKIKERQAVGRLDRFIQRYGEEEGRKKWKERQIKWQNTMKDKSKEEKKRINKLKGCTLENMIRKYGEIDGTEKYYKWNEKIHTSNFYSNISQELFYKLLENIDDKENVKFATHNNEKIIQKDHKYYLYDFCYKKKIIEFNGDIWHANPNLYKETDYPNPYLKNLTAKNIWEFDNIKNNIVKNKGYKILIIWEKDYRENYKEQLLKCLNFLQI